MTVLEVIQRSTEFLTRKGLESARLQTELLLAHVLRIPRLQLYLQFDRALTEPELATTRELVRRRGLREPLQHLIGTVVFCGHELRVDARVLIPRPETELLAEHAARLLQAARSAPPTALDFGTGSGCLAITLAAQVPAARVHAVDISTDALALARENAVQRGVSDRIRFHAGDGFGALPGPMCFDVIAANPPYIATAELTELAPEVRDHDPRVALDGGPDGLRFYRRLATEARVWLDPAGRLVLELGDGQAAPVAALFQAHKWVVDTVTRDYSGTDRVMAVAPA
jgi:release factor glutamine methyltransferase